MDYIEKPPERRGATEFSHFVPRVGVLAGVAVVVLIALVAQLVNIMLVHGAENRTLADSYPFRIMPISAPRGLIMDRDGEILASNRLVYDVRFSRFGLSPEDIKRTVTNLTPFFPEKMREWRHFLARGRRLPRAPQVLAAGLTLEEVAPLFERVATMPGVTVQESFDRNYPVRGASLGHVLGYVNSVNPRNFRSLLRSWGEDESQIDWDQMARMAPFKALLQEYDYLLADDVGVQGLEYTYERQLRGQKGRERILQDAHSQVRGGRVVEEAKPGNTLHLTLDLDLQRLGYELLAGRKGVIIALDPRDGAVLALVSSPGFDSDQPGTQRGWAQMVTDNANRPLVNRAMREVYNPGSTLKPVVALGALRDGAISTDTVFDCDDVFFVGNARFGCDYLWGCGGLTLRRALRRSCNIFFYNTVRRMGVDGWRHVMTDFGLFQKTGIDLPSESAGHPPRPNVYPGEVVQLGIGQGPFDVTPLQMTHAYAEIGMNRRVVPHLVRRIEDVAGNTVWTHEPPPVEPLMPELDPAARQEVLETMADVARDREGTAKRVRFPEEWRVAGKTGTAENRGLIDAWFIGFAPMEAPVITVGCVVEGGGHGADTAAPLVRDMMGAVLGYPVSYEFPSPASPEEVSEGD